MKKTTRKVIMLASATLLSFGTVQSVLADSTKISQIKAKIEQINKEISDLDNIGVKKYRTASGTDAYVGNLEYKIKQAEKFLNVSQQESTKNTITVSPEYARALKGSWNWSLSDQERGAFEDILVAESKKLKQSLLDTYIADPVDEQVTYDVNNLPHEVLVELNYYAVDLMNQIRRQMNLPQVKLSHSSIDFANKVSKKYVEVDFKGGEGLGHYAKGINEVATNYGFPITPKDREEYGEQRYENLFIVGESFVKLTKAELKQEIYNAFVHFLYDGDEFYHAQSIAGVNYGEINELEYFGIAPSVGSDRTRFHFILVPLKYVNESSKQNFQTEASADTSASNRSKIIAEEKIKLDAYKTELIEAKRLDEKRRKLDAERVKLYKQEEEEKYKSSNPQSQPPLQTIQSQQNNTQKPQISQIPTQRQNQSLTIKNGWQKEGDTWYYYKNNQRVTKEWVGSYYLKDDGKMAVKEWVYDGFYKAWYYLKSDGSYVRNAWQGSYYLKGNGKMADKEWVYDNTYQSWFYLKSGGAYANNQWFKVDGLWYYFKSGGYMASNTWQGNYYLKSSGAMAENEWIYDSFYKAWYYLKSDGSYARNEVIQGRYRVDDSGKWI